MRTLEPPGAAARTESDVSSEERDRLAITTIRTLAMDAVQTAHSGHPGTAMAMAPVVYCLWQRFLRFDPDDPILAESRSVRSLDRTRLDALVRDAAPMWGKGRQCEVRTVR